MSNTDDGVELPPAEVESQPKGWAINVKDAERLLRYVNEHPGISDGEACKALGITQYPVYEETPDWLKF